MTSLSCLNSVKRGSDNKRPVVERPPAVILFEGLFDRSGSTTTMYAAQSMGLKKIINDRRKDVEKTGAKCIISITTFDDVAKTYTANYGNGDEYINIKDLPDFTDEELEEMLAPRATTRLIDTAVERLNKFESKLNQIRESLKNKEHNKIAAIFCLSTDGMDNASSMYTVQEMNKIVKRLRDIGVSMLFLAANQDAIATGTTFGFCPSSALNFGADNQHTANALRSASAFVSRVARDTSDCDFAVNSQFTQIERQRSGPAAPVQYGGLPNISFGMGPQDVMMPPSNLRMRTIAPLSQSMYSPQSSPSSSPTQSLSSSPSSSPSQPPQPIGRSMFAAPPPNLNLLRQPAFPSTTQTYPSPSPSALAAISAATTRPPSASFTANSSSENKEDDDDSANDLNDSTEKHVHWADSC